MRMIYAIAMTAAVLISASAQAENTTTVTSTSCKKGYGGVETCTTTKSSGDSEPARPSQISKAQARKDQEEADARDRKWEEFCKPARSVDKFGITRLHYAHSGCEFGITEESSSFAEMR
jgi:hypothetical protein